MECHFFVANPHIRLSHPIPPCSTIASLISLLKEYICVVGKMPFFQLSSPLQIALLRSGAASWFSIHILRSSIDPFHLSLVAGCSHWRTCCVSSLFSPHLGQLLWFWCFQSSNIEPTLHIPDTNLDSHLPFVIPLAKYSALVVRIPPSSPNILLWCTHWYCQSPSISCCPMTWLSFEPSSIQDAVPMSSSPRYEPSLTTLLRPCLIDSRLSFTSPRTCTLSSMVGRFQLIGGPYLPNPERCIQFLLSL